MLSTAETELLCRVGAGTPMGEMMRQYWLPALYSWELETDGRPVRVRILGEDLIAWRDSDGKPGFIAENCPHRGASLFFGRNEESGLRCVYHGWKFDTAGRCVDMPNEPPESNFKDKVQARAYAAADWGTITWVYMGPRQKEPPGLPEWEWCTLPPAQLQHSHKTVYECNYMQALEGELDTTHVYFLHSRLDPDRQPSYGLFVADKAARLEILDTPYGVMYGARREEDSESYYWRTTQYLFPIYGMFPGGGEDGTVPLSIYLPIDDHHTLHWGLRWHPKQTFEGDGRARPVPIKESGELTGGVGPMKPEQKGRWFANWWPEANPDNDFMLKPEVQKTKNYTGLPSVRLQDNAVIWSMGPIMDRTKEHLGTADATLIRVRRRMLRAAEALRDGGVIPPGVEDPALYQVRSCQAILPKGSDWQQALDDWHHARTPEHPTGGLEHTAYVETGRSGKQPQGGQR
jgi:phthalate 4,5-dioxygenase oxygenase subunit